MLVVKRKVRSRDGPTYGDSREMEDDEDSRCMDVGRTGQNIEQERSLDMNEDRKMIFSKLDKLCLISF